MSHFSPCGILRKVSTWLCNCRIYNTLVHVFIRQLKHAYVNIVLASFTRNCRWLWVFVKKKKPTSINLKIIICRWKLNFFHYACVASSFKVQVIWFEVETDGRQVSVSHLFQKTLVISKYQRCPIFLASQFSRFPYMYMYVCKLHCRCRLPKATGDGNTGFCRQRFCCGPKKREEKMFLLLCI